LHRDIKTKNLQRWAVEWPKLVLFYPYSRHEKNYLPAFTIDMASLKEKKLANEIVNKYIDWGINRRELSGQTIRARLSLIGAALRQHPQYKAEADISWLKEVLESIPVETETELRERRIAKQTSYDAVEAVPAKIHLERQMAARKGKRPLAITVRNELLAKWFAPDGCFLQSANRSYVQDGEVRLGGRNSAGKSESRVLAVQIHPRRDQSR